MSTSIQIPVTQIGLEQSIVQGVRNASKKANLSLGGLGSGSAQKINAISQPLGRITGQADEFSKSMAAANARVLAFGASAGIMAGVSAALAGVVKSAINVEQKLSSINTVLQTTSAQLEKFGDSIFSIAKNTGQSFDIVAEGALELARQGLSAADTLSRLNDALILSRLSGLDAAKSVEGLTAAYNSFQGAGETTATILNKLVVVSQKYAVSERDLIEGVKRSASVAELAGVSFNELLGVITAVQQKTARGGAVIGNSFKTIFARIQDKGVLTDLQDLGVEVTDASKEILPATKILGNLAQQFGQLSKIQQTDLAKKLGGIYQLDKLLAGLEDLSSANSVARDAEKKAAGAREEAYEKNLLLNQTLAEVINRVTINAQELGAKLGALGVTDSLKNILSFFNNLLEGVQNLLGEESGLGKFVRGIVKGISEIVTGPGLALFAAIIVKLSKDLVVFGAQSLKSFFGIGKAAKDIKDLETSIKSALASNVDLQEQILKLGNDRYSQMKLITAEIQKQEVAQRTLQKISSDLSNPAYRLGVRAGEQGLRVNAPKKNAAEGYIPAVSQEKQNIRKGVGGAKSGDKPVMLENFNFGGGKKGSIVAHTGEYIVPNFGGSSGSAIFNRDMVRKMGLPSGARKINAAGGFIPNFAESYDKNRSLDKARAYFGKAKDTTIFQAFKNPNTPDNDLIAASEALAKRRDTAYKFNAEQFQFDNGMGIGLVSLQNSGSGNKGMATLTSNDPNIQSVLTEIGVPNLAKIVESKFKEQNIDPKLFRGVKENVLQAKPNISFENIKIGSVDNLKGQFRDDTFKDFQQTVNRLFARPISDLGNELFGSALGSVPSGDVSDKYIFGKDVLGSIFESATQFYIKGAGNLPSFQDGEATRSQRFDFPMTDPEEAKRLNNLFFKGGGVGIAEAKLTANSSTLNSIVSKSLNDERVKDAMKKQIASGSKVSMAGGFIPNFFEEGRVPEKIRQGRDFESDIFQALGLKNPGNRTLDFPPKLLNQPGLEEGKFDMGIQGSYGDVKLTDAESNKRNFLGKLIKHFGLADYIIKSFRDGGVNSISLDKRTPKIKEATMFFQGARNLFYPEEVSATLGQILKESRISKETASPLLEAFADARTNSGVKNSVALQDVFKRKKITAKINMDGVSPYADLFDKSDALNANAGADENNPFARGFIPNFANPLKEAIDREMEAGVPASQIYIDKNSSLKNAMNPMGLMVANRRDEPTGGILGINRAREEGQDPKIYGAAYGLIPNFARRRYPVGQGQMNLNLGGSATASTPAQSAAPVVPPSVTQSTVAAGQAIGQTAAQASAATISLADAFKEFQKEVEPLIKKINKDIKSQKISRTEGTKQIQDLAESKLGGRVSDKSIQKVVGEKSEKLIPDKAPQTMSDFVSKVFLAQSVLSGLTASFSELGEGAEKFNTALATLITSGVSGFQFFEMFKTMGREQRAGRELTGNFLAAGTRRERQRALSAMDVAAQAGLPGAPGGTTRFLARRAAAVPTGAFSRGIGGASRVALSVISKVGPIFGRLIPIVGIAVTAFQAVSAITKAFGIDLNKIVFDGLVKFGQSLGIVATDAEKLSKSFQKNSKEVASALNTGTFQKGDSSFQKTIQESLTKASEEELKNRLRNSKQKSDKENFQKNFTDQLLNDQVFEINKEFFMQKSGLSAQQLEGQYKTRGFGGLQSITEENLGGSEGYGGREIIKGLSEVQGQAIASLDKDLIAQFSKSQTQKDFQKAVESKDVQQQELLIKQLQEESFAELKKLGKTDQIAALKKSIAEGGDLKDLEVLKKVNKERAALFGDLVKAAEVEKQLNLVDLQIAQQKLDNLIKYKTALLDIPSIQENSLSIEKELINTTDARKVSIERELTARKAAIDLTKQQTDAAAAFLKDQGAIQAILQKAGINEATEESFREVASIVEGVSDQIRLQGGYTDDVAKSTEELLQSKLKSKEAVERISELLKGQMTALSDQQQIQLAIQDIELKRNSIHEARNNLLKMENDQKLQAIDSIKEELSYQERIQDLASRSFKTRADALKEVSPRSIQFDVEGLQNLRDRASARLKNTNQQQSIFRDLQKDLLRTALEKNFKGLADEIQKATNLKDLEAVGEDLVKAEKQAAIEKLNAAFDDRKITINAAGAFSNIVIGAANELAKSVGSLMRFYDEQKNINKLPLNNLSFNPPQKLLGVYEKNFYNPTKDSLNQLEKDRKAQEEAIKSSNGFSEAILKVKQALNSSSVATKDMLATLEELDFSFRAAAIKIEKNFAKLMLSFANQIAQEERKNIGLAGQIERLGMVRDFETENRANYSNIVDPQEYLKRQQSISLDYFNKIQALELEKANREIEIQFKTEQMNLENIKQLIFNTEALRQLRDQLAQDPLLSGTDVSAFTKPGSPTESITSYYSRQEAGLRSSKFSMEGSSSSGPYSSSMITVPIYDDIKTATTKINQMQEAAKNVASQGGDFVAASEEAAKNLGIAGYDVNDVAKTILDLANKYANNAEQFRQAGKTFGLSQDLEEKRAKAGTFKEGVEGGFRDLNQRRADFAFTIGKEIPTMFADGMSQALNSAIEGAASLKDALRSAAYEFVKGINQRLMSNLVDNAVGGLGNLGFGMFQAKASGGMITGGSGSKDDVPAMLMGGEYVVNKRAVAKYGPQFLEAINNGTLTGYANGGTVQRGPQGNFYTPGTFSQGAISGKRNLLDFATQSGTSGKFDQIINDSGYQAISLEPESSRLSVSGMRSTPMFEATQSAKGQAFDLYLQQYNAEKEAKKQEKAQKKALIRQLGMMVLSAALGPVIGAAGAGFGAAFKGAAGQGFMSQVGAGFKGIFTGGKIPGMEGNVGGLGNLFSGVGKAFTGDFGGAVNKFKLSQIGTQDQLLSAMKNEKFASYINQQGGFIPKAGVVQELGGIPIDASRSAGGVPFNSNDGDIIKDIQRSVGVDGSDIEAGLLSSMQRTPGFNVFKNLGKGFGGIGSAFKSGAGQVGSIFSNFLGSGYGPFDKDGNYVEEWADNPSKWGVRQFVRRATGGAIPSTSGIDTVPAMLSGGEFVMNRSAVQSIGAPNLQSMNAGGTSITSEETSKELNEKLLAKLDELIKVSDSSAAGNITINVAPSGQTTQEGSQDASANRQQLARQIKDAVLQVINDEKRIGGSLRR